MIQLLRYLCKVPAMVLAVLLVVPGAAHAGDVAVVELIGFSADGRRFAIVQSGIEDGSGRAYARLDVAAAGGREALRRQVVLEEGREPAEARTALLAAADGELARLGFVVTAAEAGPAVTAVDSLPGVARALIGERREVAIELHALPHTDAICAAAAAETQAIELVVRNGSPVLGRQAWRPELGECVLEFGIAAARTLGRDQRIGLAVVVAYSRLGFEGPDVRFVPLLVYVASPPG